MKKIFLIITAVLVAGILVVAGVYLRMRDTSGSEPASNGGAGGSLPQNSGGSSGESEDAPRGNLPLESYSVAEARALEFYVDPSGETKYVREDGQIVRVTSASSTLISTAKIADILSASFSFDGKRLLVKAGSAVSPRWSVYDLEKNSWRQIQAEARDMEWAPGDNRVAYIARRTSKSDLVTLDLGIAGSRPRTYLSLNAEDLVARWGGSSRLFISERPAASLPGNLWVYDLSKSSLALAAESVPGIHVSWGQKDQGLLFKGRANGRGGTLHLAEGTGKETQMFSFLTLPEKCTFYRISPTSTSENIACAIPKDARTLSSAQLPDDYHKFSFRTTDDFYLVSSADTSMTRVVSDLAADAVRLRVSGKYLYFLNRLDSKIYRLQIAGG